MSSQIQPSTPPSGLAGNVDSSAWPDWILESTATAIPIKITMRVLSSAELGSATIFKSTGAALMTMI
eukprot:CAMPEP_0170485292 /NCGR_PEP_ID=MMETSP0208-20121228/4597_1 /TAXON_ID=197538 /ORGANISM="Strombidium inclinatum, Strain S3" /LENGTH=66 /DNA_ID=CAMNT_0010758901 /DNA_START=261 /DNA_END=461 /DNA_ORIENTATION=-